MQNHGESGVDCGGPCPACVEGKPALIEYPSLICTKSINPFENDAKWFLLIVAVLAGLRLWLYSKELQQLRGDQLLDEFKRARLYFERRREMILFILVILAVVLLSYGYYYLFLLCSSGYEYLWLFLLVLVLFPLVIYSVIRWLTYSDERRLEAQQREERTHEETLQDLLAFENEQLVEIERDLAKSIEEVAADHQLLAELNMLPELKQIYADIVELYHKYHENKTPTGIEKELCDQVYSVETDEHFVRLAREYPEINMIYKRLALLYRHYEEKQKLYDELAGLESGETGTDGSSPEGAEGSAPAQENGRQREQSS